MVQQRVKMVQKECTSAQELIKATSADDIKDPYTLRNSEPNTADNVKLKRNMIHSETDQNTIYR